MTDIVEQLRAVAEQAAQEIERLRYAIAADRPAIVEQAITTLQERTTEGAAALSRITADAEHLDDVHIHVPLYALVYVHHGDAVTTRIPSSVPRATEA